MKILIIFDSFFGNTEQIGRAIGTALAGGHDTMCVRVGDASVDMLAGVDLLIAGSPTRGFRPTPALNAFIDSIPAGRLSGISVTAFDTRIEPKDVNNILYTPLANIFGFAAKPIMERLVKKGGRMVVSPVGFQVTGEKGPLKAGELERAASWARQIADAVLATVSERLAHHA